MGYPLWIFAAAYLERPDDYGHTYGPDAPEIRDLIREVDGHLNTLLDQLAQPGYDNINLMIFSDHGMARLVGDVNTSTAIINILDYNVNSSDWRYAAGDSTTPVLHIWPQPGREDYVGIVQCRCTYFYRFNVTQYIEQRP